MAPLKIGRDKIFALLIILTLISLTYFANDQVKDQIVQKYVKLSKALETSNTILKTDEKWRERDHECKLSTCFEFSRCPFNKSFTFSFIDWAADDVAKTENEFSNLLKIEMKTILAKNPHYIKKESDACVVLVFKGEVPKNYDKESEKFGENHIFLNFDENFVDVGHAMLANTNFNENDYRHGFDLVLPSMKLGTSEKTFQESLPMMPIFRKFLISHLEDSESLEIPENIFKNENFLTCRQMEPKLANGSLTCGNFGSPEEILKNSTFTLLTISKFSSEFRAKFQEKFYEALRFEAIPVILDGDSENLPFSEVIEWERAAIFLPAARISEIEFLLQSFHESDVFSMRRQGRMIWEKYLSTTKASLDSMIANIRDRLGFPASPAHVVKTVRFTNVTLAKNDFKAVSFLGPVEAAKPSLKFQRSFTISRLQKREMWNDWFSPFFQYPSLPFDPVLSTDAKFKGSTLDFRPVNKGAGGFGKVFSESIGGNYPYEQFTIVFLTFDRVEILNDSMIHLKGLPYLNKVVVVWNSPKNVTDNLVLPEIGVEVVVVKASKNSLNNRFLPLDCIETDAILSLDDDVRLNHDEMIFAFKVWRENRNRLVGFPARYHGWTQNEHWKYENKFGCEFSMILTGATFYHSYYSYMYSYWMKPLIREKVDEYRNCEDIAMNFLIAHVTRHPPVKVSTRTLFPCPKCKSALNHKNTHYQERSICINYFSEVYGYNPLLISQYRVDSIFYNTKRRERCFDTV